LQGKVRQGLETFHHHHEDGGVDEDPDCTTHLAITDPLGGPSTSTTTASLASSYIGEPS
jgi:hypothetical protein